MKNKAFTLIELLAVIIILGILMLIAIPSVTGYINNSRKETYVSTINELIKGTSNLVNGGELDVYDTNTTYLIPISAIELESGKAKSPFGEIEEGYVAVTYDGEEFDYYAIIRDSANMGLSELTSVDVLNKNSIEYDVTSLSKNAGIKGQDRVVIFKNDLSGIERELTATSFVSGFGKNYNPSPDDYLCVKATNLHHETCESTYKGCILRNTYSNGDEIYYGQIGQKGKLTPGDAFDCDVNNDGTFDEETERFYYVSPYYDGETDTFDNKYATLIFYTNISTGLVPTRTIKYAYRKVKNANTGPDNAIEYLPTTSQWSNQKIYYPTKRVIRTNYNKTIVNNGVEIDNPFDYTGKAARLLTLQEVLKVCVREGYTGFCNFTGDIIKYRFFFENSEYSRNTSADDGDYWLETPRYDLNDYVYFMDGSEVRHGDIFGTWDDSIGIRPAISVNVKYLEY